MSQKTWVVVANSSKARLFSVEPGPNLNEQETLVHPASRMADRELQTDKPGRTFASAGSSSSGMSKEISPKEHEIIGFAKEVADLLEKEALAGHFDRLFLASSPEFLGLLRKSLNGHCGEKIERQLDKDLTAMNAPDIWARFTE